MQSLQYPVYTTENHWNQYQYRKKTAISFEIVSAKTDLVLQLNVEGIPSGGGN